MIACVQVSVARVCSRAAAGVVILDCHQEAQQKGWFVSNDQHGDCSSSWCAGCSDQAARAMHKIVTQAVLSNPALRQKQQKSLAELAEVPVCCACPTGAQEHSAHKSKLLSVRLRVHTLASGNYLHEAKIEATRQPCGWCALMVAGCFGC